jgi:hypothetical protein
MALNAVERRLVDLCEHWVSFRDNPLKRLLVWQVADNAMRMVQCFFQVQKHETPYTSGDLFIVFDLAFDNSIQYSRELKEALVGQYEASRQDLETEGVAPEWQCTPTQFPDSAYGFIQCLRSFGSQHHKSIGHLVAVLTPSALSNPDAFSSWLRRALDARLPERLRIAVIDSSENPRLQGVTEVGDDRVFVDAPPIDATATAQETFAQETTVGPAGVFRNYLMGLVSLVEKGSLDQVKAKATDAQAFARKEGWFDQEVVVATFVAGALLKEGRFDEAVTTHQEARKAAAQATAAGHPAGPQLVLQTWFGEAGVHLAADRPLEAARCYDEAAVVAQQSANLILAIEAFRMGAFCHARFGQREEALTRGKSALTVGARLKPASRSMTTLPIAAMDLLSLVEPERAEAIKDVKRGRDARESAIRTAAEARAAEVETTENFGNIRVIEDRLGTDLQNSEERARKEVEAVVQRSGTEFHRRFAETCELLGPDWPLVTAAIPRMSLTREGDGSVKVLTA